MSDYVLDYVWAFALALIITFALTPLVKRFAVAVGAIDKPDARKVHHGAIPRLGGLAIFLGYVGGGDPAAPSDTATLLRLHPSYRTCLRQLPPCGWVTDFGRY